MELESMEQKYKERKNMSLYDRKNKALEDSVLLDIRNNGNIDLFVSGALGGSDVGRNSITAVNVILSTIYRVYENYPELNVDKLLRDSLIRFANEGPAALYQAMDTFYSQMKFEKSGEAPFKLNDPAVLKALREGIAKNEQLFKTENIYRGRLYDNNVYGYAEEIDREAQAQNKGRIL